MTTATNEALKEVQEATTQAGKSAQEKYEQSVKELEEQGKVVKVTTPTASEANLAKRKYDEKTAAAKAEKEAEKPKAEKPKKKFVPGLHSTIVVSKLTLTPPAGNGRSKVKITNSETGKTRTLKSYYAVVVKDDQFELYRTCNDNHIGTYKTGYSLVKQGLGKDTVTSQKFETVIQEPKAEEEAKAKK